MLTGYTCEQLSCEILNLSAGKRHETVALEEIKNTLTQKIGYNANVVAVVEAIA